MNEISMLSQCPALSGYVRECPRLQVRASRAILSSLWGGLGCQKLANSSPASLKKPPTTSATCRDTNCKSCSGARRFDFATCLSSPKKSGRRSRMTMALERLEGKQRIIRMINYEQPHPLTIGANHSIFALDMAGPSAPRCTGRSSYLACA